MQKATKPAKRRGTTLFEIPNPFDDYQREKKRLINEPPSNEHARKFLKGGPPNATKNKE